MKTILTIGMTLAVTSIAIAQTTPAPQPSICNRACWGASSSSCGTSLGSLTRAIIHHTAGSGDFTTNYETAKAKVRGVQNLHKNNNGWCDIGYHFMVSNGGHIFEGRAGSIGSSSGWKRGNHAGCGNNNSMGFTFLGYFHTPYNHSPSTAMQNAMYDVIAWRMPSGWSPYGGRTSYPGSMNGTAAPLDTHSWVGANSGGGCSGTACPGSIIINNFITSNFNGGPMRTGIANRRGGTPPPPPPPPAGPDAVSWGAGRYDVVVRGGSNKIYHKFFSGGSWAGSFTDLGGISQGSPGITSMAPGRLDVFIRGTDNAIYQRFFANGVWSGSWVNLGGSLTSGPDATSWGPGRIDIVARGGNNRIYQKFFSNGQWSGTWTDLGGSATSDPSICSWGENRLDIFVRSTDNALWHKWYSGGAWSGWENLGGVLASAPDATSWGNGRIDVVYRGTDNKIYQRFFANGQWSGVTNLGGTATADPTISSGASGRLDVYYRGTDGALYHRFFSGGAWGGVWENLGGTLH